MLLLIVDQSDKASFYMTRSRAPGQSQDLTQTRPKRGCRRRTKEKRLHLIAGAVKHVEPGCSGQIEAFLDPLHPVEQLIHGKLLMRHVLEEMHDIASHVEDRGFDTAEA